MFAYVMVGTNDKARACEFYDALMGEMGMKRLGDIAHITSYGSDSKGPFLMVCTPIDRKPASVGNGSMIALAAGNKENVERIYRKALELGATDEGAPGVRGGGLYCAYFRDLDGNKFNACCPPN